ncbi:hypothetical protein ANO14919_031180 [Xylariales sp. No.14919]|nr:hypothetical protein ANO14919_031180 [Xylariales sp. No.14919]
MGYSLLATLRILSGIGIPVASAQQLAYTSFAVTECVGETSSMLDPAAGQPAVPPLVMTDPGKPGVVGVYPETVTVSYTMPPCTYCGCPDCTVLSSFVTTCSAFNTAGTLGMGVQTYAITETYLGLSSLPRFEQPTQIPYGFTSQVETCGPGVCGPHAITATMTYPIGGGPFAGATAPVGSAECGSESGNDCSTLSTQYHDTGTSKTAAAAPTPVPARPTVVAAEGSSLERPLEIIGMSLLLMVAL